jgi:hypothetical protein
MVSLLTFAGFCLHLAIGAGFGAIFLSAAFAQHYHARNVWNFWRAAVHYGVILIAAVVFLFAMIFVATYQLSWANMLALTSSALFTALSGWRLLFGAKSIDGERQA